MEDLSNEMPMAAANTLAGVEYTPAYWLAQNKLNLLRMAHDITRDNDIERLIKTADRIETWSEGKQTP